MTVTEKVRYNELMRVAQYGDYMSETEFDELMGLFKKLGK